MAKGPTDPILRTDLAGLTLRNPVILAAGTAGYLDEFQDALNLARVGAVIGKSITRLPRDGHETWRIIESDSGMLNAVGLANMGLDAWTRDLAPSIAHRAAAIGLTPFGSISGFSIEDYLAVADAMNKAEGLPAVEINVSCPNVHTGTSFGESPDMLRDLIAELRATLTAKRMIVKLSPLVFGPMLDIARAAIEARARPGGPNNTPGADILCISNTMPAMAIDVESRKPRLSNTTGGLSGPAIHPIAVRLIHIVYKEVAKPAGIPIIGLGGVLRWQHAAEFILAGATAVGMGTALFVDPRSPIKVASGLADWARRQGASNIGELVGGVVVHPDTR
ncbi:MAG: dihydroorotate dehydrogenase [Phycisphaeraceae bacterium]|nr:dihydroorotate dehydrogenase [Phycisphaeraceae bacterium]